MVKRVWVHGDDLWPNNRTARHAEYIAASDYDALAARLAALELSAWDVHEAISDALDSPEDANERTIRRVLDEMGELLPAHRPADSATRQESDAHG